LKQSFFFIGQQEYKEKDEERN